MRQPMIRTAILAIAVTTGTFLSCARSGDWTSSSKEAVREFELGIESRMKLYSTEARGHFERALELDPEFVAAKLVLARMIEDKEERERIVGELEAIDPDALTGRERFMLRYALARYEDRNDEASEIVRDYLDKAPDDPYGVAQLAEEAWYRQDWSEAESAYARLLELDPNWVTAQNHLGYMAMAQGDFAEAEERFLAYRFVAPDQANPHDSMGELLTVVGRYEEAEAELEKALAIRPDFCASYMHMIDVLILDGRPYDGYKVLERAESNCDPGWEGAIREVRCELAFWIDYLDRDFDAPWGEDRAACMKEAGSDSFIVHRIASVSGRWEVALEIEAAHAEDLERSGGNPAQQYKALRGVLGHLVGVRLLAQGEIDEAIEEMQAADETLFYWGQNQGILKLFNRLNLAFALVSAGREQAADEVLADVRAVNAPFADVYRDIEEVFSR